MRKRKQEEIEEVIKFSFRDVTILLLKELRIRARERRHLLNIHPPGNYIHQMLHSPVKSVEVYPGRHVSVEELLDEGARLVDAVVPDGLVVVLQRRHHVYYVLRHVQLRELDDVPQRLVALDGHDAGHDRTVDADGPTVVDELDECVRLEEQLRDDEVSASVNLRENNIVYQIHLKTQAVSVTIHSTIELFFLRGDVW